MTFNELRTAAGMSRKAFAEYFEIPIRTVDHWDIGDRECPVYLLKLMKYKLEKETIITAPLTNTTKILKQWRDSHKMTKEEFKEAFGIDFE